MTTTQRMEIESPEAREMIARSGRTMEPCPRPEHRGLGCTSLMFALDREGKPEPRFTSNRVLFHTCLGCSDERWERQMPDCPASHRPYRGTTMDGNALCRACGRQHRSGAVVRIA